MRPAPGVEAGVRPPATSTKPLPRRQRGPLVADVLFLAILVAFFALTVVFVHACERIIGPDLEAAPPAETAEPERTAA
jgi:hypothetical protein